MQAAIVAGRSEEELVEEEIKASMYGGLVEASMNQTSFMPHGLKKGCLMTLRGGSGVEGWEGGSDDVLVYK